MRRIGLRGGIERCSAAAQALRALVRGGFAATLLALALLVPQTALAQTACDAAIDNGATSGSALQNLAMPAMRVASITVDNAVCRDHFTPTFTLTGTLPAGLSLQTVQDAFGYYAEVVGTPTAAPANGRQYFQFTLHTSAYDKARNETMSQDMPFYIVVNAAVTSSLNTPALTGGNLLLRAGTSASSQPVKALYGIGTRLWSISPALPSGLTLDAASGAINGAAAVGNLTPTTYTLTVRDQNLGATVGTASTPFTMVIEPALETVLNPSIPVPVTGVALTPFRPVTASGGVGTLTYALEGQLPPGLSFNTASGEISGTATDTFGSNTYRVVATDGAGFTSAKSFSLPIAGPGVRRDIASKVLTSGVQEFGFVPVAKIGGTGAVTYSISPALPAGLTIDPSSGTISGKPTARIAATQFTVSVRDSGSPQGSASASFQLSVVPNDAVVFSMTPSGGASEGGTTVTITGANFGPANADATVVTIGGLAMPGVSVSPDGGTLTFTTPELISGGIRLGGIQPVKVQNAGTTYYQPGLTFAIKERLRAVGTIDPQSVTVGKAVRFGTVFIAPNTGTGTLTYSTLSPLPGGLTLDPADGTISGTPDGTGVSGEVTYSVTVEDQDSPATSITQTGTIRVLPALAVTATQPAFVVRTGNAVNITPVTVGNAVGGITATISPSLPRGLTLDPATGTITGTATNASPVTTYRLSVADGQTPFPGTGAASFTLEVRGFTIAPNPAYAVNDNRLWTLDYSSGSTYGTYNGGSYANASPTVTPRVATGGVGSITWSISPALPAGLSMNPATGEISGAPTERRASQTYTITATDGDSPAASQSSNILLSVTPNIVSISAVTPNKGSLAGGTSVTVTGDGFGPTYADTTEVLLGGVPVTGVVFAPDGKSLTFTTPPGAAAGPASLAIANVAPVKQVRTANFTYEALPQVKASVTLPEVSFARGVASSFTPVTASSGTAPYSYSISPALPAGITLNATTGAISGTSNVTVAAATYTMTVRDAANPATSATASFSLLVGNAVTPTGAPTFTSITPSVISASGGTQVTVRGTNFAPNTVFAFGNTGTSAFATNVVVAPDGTSATMTTPSVFASTLYISASLSFPTLTVNNAYTFVNSPQSTLNSWLAFQVGRAITPFKPINVTGGVGTLHYSATGPGGAALPAGITYDPATGFLSGTPTAVIGSGRPSAMDVTFTATDSDNPARSTSKTATIEVTTPQVTTLLIPHIILQPGVPVSGIKPVGTSGGVAWSLGATPYETFTTNESVPDGMTFDFATGTYSGTPVTPGALPITMVVTDLGGSGSGVLTQDVNFIFEVSPTLSATHAADVTANVNQAVNVRPVTAAGGVGPITYALSGSLPDGLVFNPATGAVTGTAHDPAPLTTFTVTATDAAPNPATATQTFTLRVDVPAPTITGLSQHSVDVGGSIALVITGTGFRQYPTLPGTFEVGFTSGGFGVASPSFRIDSDTQITATTPALAGAYNAYVKLPQGQSADTAADDIAFGNLTAVPVTLNGPGGSVGGDFQVQVVFGEAVKGFTKNDFSVTNGTVTALSGSGTSYFATVHPTALGVVKVQVLNFTHTATAIASAAPIGSSAELAVTYRTAGLTVQMVPFDAMGMPVTAANGPVELRITFNEDVADFTLSDLTFGAGDTLSNFIVDAPNRYRVTLDRASDGDARITLPSGSVKDSFGAVADTTGTLAVTFDRSAPTLTVSGPPLTVLQRNPFQARFDFSEDVTGFDSNAVFASGGQVLSVSAVDGKRSYLVTVQPRGTGLTQLIPSLFNVKDMAGNGAQFTNTVTSLPNPLNSTAPQPTPVSGPSWYVDTEAPYVTVSQSGGANPTAAPFDVKIEFTGQDLRQFGYTNAPDSDAVNGFTLSDLSVTNGSASNLTCPVQGAGVSLFGPASATCFARITPTGAGQVDVSVPAGAAADRAGNANQGSNMLSVQMPAAGTSAPGLTLSRPLDATNTAQQVTFTFTKAVTDFDESDLVLNPGTEAFNFTPVDASTYTAQISRTTDGTATVSVPAAAAREASGLPSPAASTSFAIDVTRPTVQLGLPFTGSAAPSTAFDVTVTFSEGVSDFALADLLLTNATATNLRGAAGDRSYIVSIVPADTGDLRIAVATGAARDATGNVSVALAGQVFTVDRSAPTPALTMAAPAATVNAPFTLAIDFGRSVTGFDLSDIAVTGGSASNLTGSGQTYAVTITPSADGTVTVNVPAGAANDAGGKSSLAATPFAVQADITPPAVTIAGPSALQSGAFTATITFTKPVTGFDVSDLVVTNGALSAFTGSGASYTVTVTPAADGAVTLAIAAGAARDSAGNASTAAATFQVQADVTAPGVTLTGPSGTQAGAFALTVTFSETVTGFELADLVVANGTASALTGSGASYGVTITPAATGPVTVDVAAAAATDQAGLASTAAKQFAVAADLTVPPSAEPVITMVAPAAKVTAPFALQVDFGMAVTGFELADITVTGGTAGNLAGSGARYTVDITPTADGDVTVAIGAGAVSDVSGRPSVAGKAFTVSADVSAPQPVITGPSATQSAAFPVAIAFSESVTGFDMADLVVTNATLSAFTGSGATYGITVTPLADGPVTLAIAKGAANDASGNASLAATTYQVRADVTPPSVQLAGPSGTQVGPFTVTAVFSEAVTGLDLADFAVTGGSASALTGSGASYSVTITPAATGTVTVTLPAGAAADAVGLASTAASPLSVQADLTRPVISPTEPNLTLTMNINASETDLTRLSSTLSLRNSGSIAASFIASVDVDWLDLAPRSGNLAAGQTAPITVTANSRVNRLTAGTYRATITVTYGSTTSTAGSSTGIGALATSTQSSFQVPVVITVAPRQGTVTIVAVTTPAGAAGDGTFAFASAEPKLSGISLTTSSGRATSTTITLDVGKYDLTEALPAGWVLSDIACAGDSDRGSNFSVPTRTALIDVDGGEAIVCTFTNSREENYVQIQTRRAIVAFLAQRARLIAASDPNLSNRANVTVGGKGTNGQFSLTGDGQRFNLGMKLSLASLWTPASAPAHGAAAGLPGSETAPPSGAPVQPDFDVWMQLSYARSSINDSRTNTHAKADFGMFYLGADYKVADGVRLGLLGQYDITKQDTTRGQANGEGKGWMIGPYVAASLDNGLDFDARVEWGKAHNEVTPIGTYVDRFDSERLLAQGHVSGRIVLATPDAVGSAHKELAIRPEASVFYFRERQLAYVNPLGMTIGSNTVSLGEASFGPELIWSATDLAGNSTELSLKVAGVAAFDQLELVDQLGLIQHPLAVYSVRLETGIMLMRANGLQIQGRFNYDGVGSSTSSTYGLHLVISKGF